MNEREPHVAMILAGGLGSRLRPVVADRPKCLVDVGGRPFLAYLLDQLVDAGVSRVVLCTGYLGDQVEVAFGDVYGGMEIVYSQEAQRLDTAGALRNALTHVSTERVTVLNGDSYCEADLAAFRRWADERDVAAAMVCVTVEDASRFGCVGAGPEGRVQTFAEKTGTTAPGLINAGIYRLRTELLSCLPANCPISLERELLPHLVDGRLQAFHASGRFLDIGTPQSLQEAQDSFGGERAGLLLLDRDGTVIEEKHYLGDPEQVELLPGVSDALRELQQLGYELAIVTNQSGIARGYFGEADLEAVNARMLDLLAAEGVRIRGVWHCPHGPEAGCDCRKPATGMFDAAVEELHYDPSECVVVGDKSCDIELGRNAGARTALVRTGYGEQTATEGTCQPDVIVADLVELARKEARR